MTSRLFIAVLLCLGLAQESSRAATDGLAEAMKVVGGIGFEEIEARWEGGLQDWTLVVTGSLPGVNKVARYEHRMRKGPEGWEASGGLTVPLAKVEDVSGLLAGFPALEGVLGSGAVALSATFTGRGEEKKWEGTLQLRDLSLEHREMELSVEGLSGTFAWGWARSGLTTDSRQVLRFRSLAWDEIRTRDGELAFALLSDDEWRLDHLAFYWAGGRLSASPFSIDPGAPDTAVRMRADGVRLDDLLQLAPEFEARGDGIIDGELSLRIRRDGLALEPGHLALRAGEPARLQLPPKAWFTGNMLPEQTNYRELQILERALEDLELERFRLEILSEETREAPLQLVIAGQPMARDVPVPAVSLTLNVHGPIRELGSWALSPGVGIGRQ